MSRQLQASPSPGGEPPNTRLTGAIQIPDEESEVPDSSQMELVNLPVDTPNLRRNKSRGPNYKECGNTDSETQDATHEASAESEDAAEDIPARRKITVIQTRSRTKKETENSERVTPDPACPYTTKRSHGNHETETTRPAKRGRPSIANAEIKKFEKDCLGLVERFASKFRELETTRSENQELKKEIKLLRSALEKERADRTQTELEQGEDITRLESEAKRWRIKLESALDEIKKDSGKYIKVSDSEIKGDWLILSCNIRNLVAQYLTEIPANQDTTLESLVRSHRLLSIHDISPLRSCILQRTVWRSAVLPVFSGRQSVWQGELGATLTHFLSTKNIDHMGDTKYLQTISQIKSRVVADLSDDGHLNMEAMEVLIGKVTKQLIYFIPEPKVEHFKNEMEKLIKKAAALHSIMMKSKAIFLVKWIGDKDGEDLARYDETKMASLQYGKDFDTSNSSVKFVESPALVKIGNADGEQFDTSMVLCQSQVILEEGDDEAGDDEAGDGEDGDIRMSLEG